MERRMGEPRLWERSLAWRRSCIQSWRPKPGLRDFLVRGCWVGRFFLMGRVVSFMVVESTMYFDGGYH